MITGVGTDIVSIKRVRKILEAHDSVFLHRILSQRELACLDSTSPEFIAGRWAAKEAVAKALGCGFGSQCSPCDITILNDSNGKPSLLFDGKTKCHFESVAASAFISISHERDYATAMVILEK